MNYRTLFLKAYVAFLMMLVVTVFSFESVLAIGSETTNTEGEVTSFGFNNPTVISNLSIVNGSSLSRASTNQALQFNIRDLDGFEHLDVYIVLYKASGTSLEGDSGLALQHLNSGVSDDALVLRWISKERSLFLSGLGQAFDFTVNSGFDNFYVKSGASPIFSSVVNSGVSDFKIYTEFTSGTSGRTWEVNDAPTVTTVESGVVNVFDDQGDVESSGVRVLERTITIPILISKVFPKTNATEFAVIVYDRLQDETTTTRTGVVVEHYLNANINYGVEYYGEIAITTVSPKVVFSGVQAGSGFFDSSGFIEARFISNDLFNQQFSADTTFKPNAVAPLRPELAFLVPASGLSASIPQGLEPNSERDPGNLLNTQGNRFVLKAFRQSIAGNSDNQTTPVDLRLKVPVGSGGQVIPTDALNTLGTPTRIYALNRTVDAIPSEASVIGDAVATTEAGVLSEFGFQIKFSPRFQTEHFVVGTGLVTTVYTANINLIISNKIIIG